MNKTRWLSFDDRNWLPFLDRSQDCLDKANLGDHAAQARLSLRLFCGDGAPLDIGEAYQWLEKAAENESAARACFKRGCERGEAGAMYGLYVLQIMTTGHDRQKTCSHYLVAAAERNYVQAQCLLGINHLYNAEQYGFEDSPEKAEYWLLKALDNGSTQPYSHLYHLYNEYLQPADPERAFQYILKAAADGLPSDMGYLAEAYEQGRGVEKNLVEAAKWYYLRAAQYAAPSCDDLERVCRQLSQAELDHAVCRCRDWIANDAKKANRFEMVAEPLAWPTRRAMDRKQVGQERLGAPIVATFDALVGAVDRKPWPDFQREPVGYYFNKMIGAWLLRLMDNVLSDERLEAVVPEDVTAITLLLLRDMFRHNSDFLRPDTPDAGWVEGLFQEVAGDLKLPLFRLRDNGQAYELEDMGNCGWARTLAEPFGLPAEKLFACHSAIVTGAREEFSGDQ